MDLVTHHQLTIFIIHIFQPDYDEELENKGKLFRNNISSRDKEKKKIGKNYKVICLFLPSRTFF